MAASGATKTQHGQFQLRARTSHQNERTLLTFTGRGAGLRSHRSIKGACKIRVSFNAGSKVDRIDLSRIVAVPGIGKDEEWSWKLNRTHWLRDTGMLARKVPEARISIFNYYNEGFDKGPVNQRLENMARKLLQGLDNMRAIVKFRESPGVAFADLPRTPPKHQSYSCATAWEASSSKRLC